MAGGLAEWEPEPSGCPRLRGHGSEQEGQVGRGRRRGGQKRGVGVRAEGTGLWGEAPLDLLKSDNSVANLLGQNRMEDSMRKRMYVCV